MAFSRRVRQFGIELSSNWSLSVEGSALENGTIHDMEQKRGRFASEIWTVRDIESQRGRFNSLIPNHP